jgi:hypothetical protein
VSARPFASIERAVPAVRVASDAVAGARRMAFSLGSTIERTGDAKVLSPMHAHIVNSAAATTPRDESRGTIGSTRMITRAVTVGYARWVCGSGA